MHQGFCWMQCNLNQACILNDTKVTAGVRCRTVTVLSSPAAHIWALATCNPFMKLNGSHIKTKDVPHPSQVNPSAALLQKQNFHHSCNFLLVLICHPPPPPPPFFFSFFLSFQDGGHTTLWIKMQCQNAPPYQRYCSCETRFLPIIKVSLRLYFVDKEGDLNEDHWKCWLPYLKYLRIG